MTLRTLSTLLLTAAASLAQTEVVFTSVATGIISPVELQNARDGSGRLFIAQQGGVIRILKNGVLTPRPFLDLGARTLGRDECGLLGLAFPPAFASKQYFYVHYTNPACTSSIVARYRVSTGNPDVADPASESIILTQAQPYTNHNGGQLQFGPDGYLYIAYGDGGDVGDPQNRSQNPSTFLGKLLRIDTEGGVSPYRVPPTNPFVSNPAYKPEIWALGLRNPWKFAFDRANGNLWIADVGQDRNEEIDYEPAGSAGGRNYGWRIMEGFDCYPSGNACSSVGLTPPIFQYTHAVGNSIIGGYVYRGSRIPSIVGDYIYGDLVSARVWALRPNGQSWANRQIADSGMAITSFGEDETGELYAAAFFRSEIYRLDPVVPTPPTAAPVVQSPLAGQTVNVSAVTFQWAPVTGATGWALTITQAGSNATVFQGVLSVAALSTVINLPDGAYTFSLRGCAGGFANANCGPAGTAAFSVNLARPAGAPTIAQPQNGATLTISTLQFSWSAIAGATGYEVQLIDVARGGQIEISTANYGNPPATSTINSVRSSTNYQLQVRACTSACGPWSAPVNFSVSLPAVPAAAPPAPNCALQNGQTAVCNWSSVPNADIYIVQAVQPGAGPGGGPLTVASRRGSSTSATITLPPGPVSIVLAACNGNGCSPYSPPANLNPAGPASSLPILAAPVPGDATDGPTVTFAWNRIAGDDGTNTVYRLYVQDFSRGAAALDVLTKQNFWAAKFRGGGNRYDALVVANPGLPSQAQGPASGFVLRGASPTSPTMVQPRHQSREVTLTIPQGNILLGWTPVGGATLYEYLIALLGQTDPVARGVTPGLQVQIPLNQSLSSYSGIVRACPAGVTCAFGSDANWGPWSNAAGQTGVTSFLVGP